MLASRLWYANRLPARNLPHQAHPDSSMIELPHRAKCPETISGKKARMEAENTWIVVWVALHIAALGRGVRHACGGRIVS